MSYKKYDFRLKTIWIIYNKKNNNKIFLYIVNNYMSKNGKKFPCFVLRGGIFE